MCRIEREKPEHIFLNKVWELPYAEKMKAISNSHQKGAIVITIKKARTLILK